jgi:hypothetical protein
MIAYSTWTVACENSGSGKCKTRAVMGMPNQEKKEVIGKAIREFGFKSVTHE